MRNEVRQASALVLALAIAPAVSAQAEPDLATADRPDTIIVTANRPTTVGKLDVPLREQPQNVSVITRETLDDFGKPRLQDIAYATVGLQPVALQQGAQSYGFFLRGFNGAPVIVDGYYSSNNQFGSVGIVDMATVESAEVLRGPAALLYGQGNPGGVVNLTTKQPLDRFGASALFNLDQYGARRLEADITSPIAEGIGARVVGVYENSETFRRFIDQDRRLISPRVTAKIGGLAEIRLQYTYDDFRFTPDNGPGINPDLVANLPVRRSVQEPGLPKNRAVNKTFRAEADVNFAPGWKARVGYYDHNSTQPRGNLEIDPGSTISGTLIARDLITTIDADNNGAKDDMLTGQILGDFTTGPLRHRLTVAGDLIHNSSKYDYAYYSFTPIDYANPVYTPGPIVADPANLQFDGQGAFKSKVRAVYAQDLISIGEHLKVLVGLRHEKIETLGFADADATIPAGTQTSAKRTTPRFGVVYDTKSGLTFYGSYSQAFVPQYGLSRTNEPFQPEMSRSYEVGLRKQFGEDMMLTAAVYDIRKKNILVVDPADTNFNINAGVARSRGFEAELQGRVAPGWRIALGLAYTDAKIIRSVDPAFFPEGDRLPAAAKWSGLVNSTYTVQEGALEGLKLGGNLSYTGRRPYMLPNVAPTLDAYAKIDVFASYTIADTVELQLNVNNLSDERILLANGYGRVQFDQPRTVILTARWKLGALAE